MQNKTQHRDLTEKENKNRIAFLHGFKLSANSIHKFRIFTYLAILSDMILILNTYY